jgi:hypothetical protein
MCVHPLSPPGGWYGIGHLPRGSASINIGIYIGCVAGETQLTDQTAPHSGGQQACNAPPCSASRAADHLCACLAVCNVCISVCMCG